MNQPLLNNTTENYDGSQSQGSDSSRMAKIALKSVDKLQDKQEAIEKRLKCQFMTYMVFMVAAQSMNTFFVIFHMFDSEDSDETLRYKLGYVFYMIFFFLQSAMLIGTYIGAWVIYMRLALFLKPNQEADDSDELFEDGS